MGRLALAVSDLREVINLLLSTIRSLTKSKSSSGPTSSTSEKEIDSIDSNDWGIFALPPPAYPSPPPEPSPGFELKPAGPEKEPWLGIPSLQNSDDYEELVSNRWNYNRKRSSIIFSPSFIIMVPSLLTYIIVQYQDPLIKVVLPGGEYSLSYSQKLSIFIFGLHIAVFICVAAMWAGQKLRRRLVVIGVRKN